MNNGPTLVVKGIAQIVKGFSDHKNLTKKNMSRAVKVEAFRLRKELKSELKQGAPGQKALKSLTFIARRKAGRFRPNKPLSRLHLAARYYMINDMEGRVGFTGPTLSKSWKRLAEKHEEGFVSPVSSKRRRFFYWKGSEISKRSTRRKYFFIKQSRTEFKTPARPIVKPFWDYHKNEIFPNIARNFERKMAGERI